MTVRGASGLFKYEGNRGSQFLPGIGPGGELLAAGTREIIELGPAVVVRRAPLGADQPAAFQSMQRWIQRSLRDLQRGVRDLMQPLRDGPSMHGLQRERLQDEEVERPLGEID